MNELLGRPVGRTLNQYHPGILPRPLNEMEGGKLSRRGMEGTEGSSALSKALISNMWFSDYLYQIDL